MNKNRYRVIYSQARGVFVAVAEIVKSRTKATGQSHSNAIPTLDISEASVYTYKKLNPLNFAVISLLGAVVYSMPLESIANTQIIADKTAPTSQQATILNSSNGITQVNIQTPSAGGVSRNTYSQFDVGAEGAILNNSRNNVQTQLGGWVQGNPWLAKGEAKVILNEVNSSNPSQLKGYLEVAGKSAQVVIANPSGLVCDGCGVINADRFTLSTGQAVVNQGYLESFRVREGQVTLEGKGLNGSLTPYTDIYTRALNINAGLYANNLNVALGQNDINVKDQTTPQINAASSNLNTNPNKPNFTLDVGQLGGMYAGKIFLVGTENGLGVRNAGSINATAAQLTLNANGDLTNSGNIIANKEQVQINAQNIHNSGNISSATSPVTLQSQNLDNSGLISSADELHLQQSGQTTNSGKINAARIALEASQLINTGSIQQTGSQALDLQVADMSNKAGKIGVIESTPTGGGSGGTGTGNPTEPGVEQPSNPAQDGGSLAVVDSSHLPVKTYETGYIRTAQTLNNDGGKIEANGGIDLKTQSGLDNTGGQLQLGQLEVGGEQFINQSGQLIVEQANIQTDSINNEQGFLLANQGLVLQSQTFNNKEGQVLALDGIHIQNTGELDNQQGLIAAQQVIDLQTGQFNNHQGTLYSENNNIKIEAQDYVDNTAGIIQAGGNADINAKTLNNGQGQLLANNLNVQLTAQLDNTEGQMQAENNLSIASQHLNNDQGQISAEYIQLNQQNTLMNTGTIYAGQSLNIENSETVNQALIASGKDATILSKNVSASKDSTLAAGLAADGQLTGTGDLTVQADTAMLHGNIFAGNAAVIQANQDLDASEAMLQAQEIELSSKEGSVITRDATAQAQNTIIIHAKQQLNNQGGQLVANTVSLKGLSLNNQAGTIQQTGEAQLDLSFADTINNQAGQIAANAAQLNIQTGTLNNESGQIIHAGQEGLTIQAQQIDAAQGILISNGSLVVDAQNINLNQAQTQANQIKITADQFSHQQGQMLQTGQQAAAQLHIQNTLDNSQGLILSNHALEISAKQLENQTGLLQSAQDQSLSLDIAGLFNNSEGQVLSGQDLNIQAQNLNNQNGKLQAMNQLHLNVDQQLNNQQGLIAAQKQLVIQASQLDNTQGQIASLDDQVELELGAMTNSNGLVQSGTNLKIQAGSIQNQQGQLIAQQDMELNSTDTGLLNQLGQISAGSTIQILSYGLNNDAGLIQAGKNLGIDNQTQDLSNQQSGDAGGLIAQNALSIQNVQQLNNQQGFIGANTSLDLHAQQVQNQNGQIISSQDLSIQTSGATGEINNQEGLIAAQGNMQLQTAKLDNRAISATGSQIIATKDLQINVDQLLNANTHTSAAQGIDAGNIQLHAQQLDNQQGAIRASEYGSLTVEQQLDNTQGLISALQQLSIQSDSQQLKINNQQGQLLAGQQLELTAQRLSGDGDVVSLGDANIALTETYQHHQDATLQANGQLHFSTQQDLLNAGEIIAGEVLDIQADNIANTTADASLQSEQTILNAQNSLKNIGLINGDLTVVKAKQIDNEGTGRIYGTALALQADILNNRPNSDGVAPVIAARDRLDIGVKTLNNEANPADYDSQALILSAGDFYLGGSLDQNNQATGIAQTVNNAGARIESLGDLYFSAQHVNNTNANFSTDLVQVSVDKDQVKQFGGGWKTFEGEYFGGNGNEDWTVYTYDIEHYETQVKTSAPGLIQAGGNLQFENAESVVNDKSQILAGQALDINGISVDQSAVLTNIGVDGINKELYTGTQELHYLDGRGHKHKTNYNPWMQESLSSQPLAVSIAKPYQNLSASPAEIDQVQTDTLDISIEQVAGTSGSNKKLQNLTEAVVLNDKKMIHSTQVDTVQQEAASAQKDQVDVPTAAGTDTEIRAVDNSQLKVPNSALYKVNQDSNANYLIETDPAFANYKNWLSSDYMLSALGLDPSMQQKRLGDGYYEQRLVQDQVAQLTGYRFLAGYGSDEEQYKALMNNGLSFAQAYGLRPGIALTAAQVAQLTSDIVWLEEKEVTLPDGSKRKALVPQVYVKARVGDLKGDGTLISADTVNINMQGDVLNSAVIAGRNAVILNAENVNQLNGRIQANQVAVKTAKDLNIEGGQIIAGQAIQLDVGRDFNLNTTTLSSEHQIGDSYFKQTGIDRIAGLYVSSPLNSQTTDTDHLKTTISVRVGGNTQMQGAEIANSRGSTVIQTAGDVDVGTVSVGRTTHIQSDASNYNHSSYRTDVGSQMVSQGDTYLTGKNIQITGSEISSISGTTAISAQEDLKITEGRTEQKLEARNIETGGSALSKKTVDSYLKNQSDEAIASSIEGNKVILDGNNVSIRGSNVVSDELTQIQAKENISITAAENQYATVSESTVKKSGLMSSGGIGFSVGKKSEVTEQQNTQKTNTGSMVGSLKGDTNIIAGKTYQQTGSTISSQNGDVNILAQQVNIEAAKEQSTSDYKHEMEQKGLTLAVNVPVITAVQSVVESTKQVGQSKNDRVNAMAAANAGFDTYKAGQSIGKLKDALTGAATLNQSVEVGVSLTYGEQKSKETRHTESNTASQSQVYAAGKTNIVATGAGKDSNINIIGSDVVGLQGTHLAADNDVNIKAAEQKVIEESNNKSSGWNAGVTISNQTGLGVTAGGNLGKGKGNGTDTSYVNSHVGSKDSITTISSGNAANIIGGQIQGEGIQIDANELNVESLQDKATYKSKQQDISGQISVGTNGGNVSGSFSKSNVDANYASVNEQSGIFAGDDGYQINVKNNTDLKGAIITSTQQAEDLKKNSLDTGTLTYSNIQNESEYDAKGISLSAGFNAGRTDSTGQKQPNTVPSSASEIDQHASSITGVSKSIGFGLDSDKDSSVTRSGVNTSNITIRETIRQEELTGKTAEQIKSEILTDVTTDTARENSGALKNNFDKEKVQSEINLQMDVTKQFDANRQEAKAEINKKIDEVKKENQSILDKEKNGQFLTSQEKDQLNTYNEKVDNYQKLGVLLDTISTGLSAPTSSGLGIAAATLSPAASYEIGQYFKSNDAEGSTAHILAHTLLGAAVAAAGGNDALTAGLAAGGAEASAPLLSSYLYGKEAKDLTADEKSTISSITGLVASGVGTSNGDIGSTVQSGQSAQNAVENNQYAQFYACNNKNQCVLVDDKPVEQFTFFEENFIRPISVLFGAVNKVHKVKNGIQEQNEKAPNLSPEGASRPGAFNQAKRDAGIPTSMQPKEVRQNTDKRGNIQPGKQYVYEVPKEGGGSKTIIIRDDSKGHVYKDDPSQNRGPHFNTPNKDHYDY